MVLFRRMFRATQLSAIDHYAAQLALITHHVENKTFGCFVDIDSRAGTVQIALYERWFDGDRLHCEELARDMFDSDQDGTLAASAEYLAELEDLAERRDGEREAAYIDEGRLTCVVGIRPPWPAEFMFVRVSATVAGTQVQESGLGG